MKEPELDNLSFYAKRVVKSEMGRNLIKIPELAKMLDVTDAVLRNKISRGSFSAEFFLRVLQELGTKEIAIPPKRKINCSVSISYISLHQGQSTAQIEAYLKGELVGKPSLGKSERYPIQANAPLYYTLLTPSNTPLALRNLSFWEKLETFEEDCASKRYSSVTPQKTYHSPSPTGVFRTDLLENNTQDVIMQMAENPSLSFAHLQETHNEKSKQTAITAQVLTVSLPVNLDLQQGKDLVIPFIQERYVSRGLGAVVAMYDQYKDKPPYAEIIVSLRSITPEGRFSDHKDREIVRQSWVRETTKQWSERIRDY